MFSGDHTVDLYAQQLIRQECLQPAGGGLHMFVPCDVGQRVHNHCHGPQHQQVGLPFFYFFWLKTDVIRIIITILFYAAPSVPLIFSGFSFFLFLSSFLLKPLQTQYIDRKRKLIIRSPVGKIHRTRLAAANNITLDLCNHGDHKS